MGKTLFIMLAVSFASGASYAKNPIALPKCTGESSANQTAKDILAILRSGDNPLFAYLSSTAKISKCSVQCKGADVKISVRSIGADLYTYQRVQDAESVTTEIVLGRARPFVPQIKKLIAEEGEFLTPGCKVDLTTPEKSPNTEIYRCTGADINGSVTIYLDKNGHNFTKISSGLAL